MRRIGFAVVVMVLVVAACSSAAEPLPGDFEGTGSDGFTIAFTVTDDLHVPQFDIRMSCGPITRQESVSVDPMSDVSDGSFSIDLPTWGIEGTFAGGGTEVSGTWHSGSCSGSWDGDRTG